MATKRNPFANATDCSFLNTTRIKRLVNHKSQDRTIQHTISKAHAMNREDRGVRRHAGCTAVRVSQLDAGADSNGFEGHGW